MDFNEPNISSNEAPAYFKGRGAQINPHNRFLKDSYVKEFAEGIDDWEEENKKTRFFFDHAKTIVNKVDSPDVGMYYSLNPYQGCEHGCIYCYARNSHQFWGYSAGLDFERKIIVKRNAPQLFKRFLDKKGWQVKPISLSGNTDCYQPAERQFELTRKILEIALEYKQPMGIITKNSLILRDIDILQEMAKYNLIQGFVSVTTMDEKMRLALEPRTTTIKQRLRIIEELSKAGIPMGSMVAPLIPGLTDHELPAILKAVADHGAKHAGYTIVRLNGAIATVFEDWLHKNFPDRAQKIWHLIQSCHGGEVNDSTFGKRMHGEGNISQIINQMFKLHCRKNELNKTRVSYNSSLFKRKEAQLSLF